MSALTRRGRRQYDRLFRANPLAANMWLLLLELADDNGEVRLGADPEGEIDRLFRARFPDPLAYQLDRNERP